MIDIRGLRDRHLSWKAKGQLAYIMSLPDDWEIHVSELHTHARDGRESTASGLNELHAAGYAFIATQGRDSDGHFMKKVWIVYEVSRKPGRVDVKGRDMSHREAAEDFTPPWHGPELDFPKVEETRNGKPATENPQRETRNGEPATGNPYLPIIEVSNTELPTIDLEKIEDFNHTPDHNPNEEFFEYNDAVKRATDQPSPVPAAPSLAAGQVYELPDDFTAEDCYLHLVSRGTNFEVITVRELLDADEAAGGTDMLTRMGFAHLMCALLEGPMIMTFKMMRRHAGAQPGELVSPLTVCEQFMSQAGAAKVIDYRRQAGKLGNWFKNHLVDERKLATSAKTISSKRKPQPNGYPQNGHRTRPTTESAVTFDDAALAARSFAASRSKEPE